jgi:hypothetical protein
MGEKRQNKFDTDRDSMPSDISENAWDELPKYQYHKYLEMQKQEKLNNRQKQKSVLNTINKQIEEQNELKKKRMNDIKEMDLMILAKA